VSGIEQRSESRHRDVELPPLDIGSAGCDLELLPQVRTELPSLLGVKPVRSDLICLLVTLDRRYTAGPPADPWPAFYAREIQSHYAR